MIIGISNFLSRVFSRTTDLDVGLEALPVVEARLAAWKTLVDLYEKRSRMSDAQLGRLANLLLSSGHDLSDESGLMRDERGRSAGQMHPAQVAVEVVASMRDTCARAVALTCLIERWGLRSSRRGSDPNPDYFRAVWSLAVTCLKQAPPEVAARLANALLRHGLTEPGMDTAWSLETYHAARRGAGRYADLFHQHTPPQAEGLVLMSASVPEDTLPEILLTFHEHLHDAGDAISFHLSDADTVIAANTVAQLFPNFDPPGNLACALTIEAWDPLLRILRSARQDSQWFKLPPIAIALRHLPELQQDDRMPTRVLHELAEVVADIWCSFDGAREPLRLARELISNISDPLAQAYLQWISVVEAQRADLHDDDSDEAGNNTPPPEVDEDAQLHAERTLELCLQRPQCSHARQIRRWLLARVPLSHKRFVEVLGAIEAEHDRVSTIAQRLLDHVAVPKDATEVMQELAALAPKYCLPLIQFVVDHRVLSDGRATWREALTLADRLPEPIIWSLADGASLAENMFLADSGSVPNEGSFELMLSAPHSPLMEAYTRFFVEYAPDVRVHRDRVDATYTNQLEGFYPYPAALLRQKKHVSKTVDYQTALKIVELMCHDERDNETDEVNADDDPLSARRAEAWSCCKGLIDSLELDEESATNLKLFALEVYALR